MKTRETVAALARVAGAAALCVVVLAGCAPQSQPTPGPSSPDSTNSSASPTSEVTQPGEDWVAPPPLCEGDPITEEEVLAAEPVSPHEQLELANGMVLSAEGESLTWHDGERTGEVALPPERMGIHVDGNHVLLLRADEATWGMPWELYLWDGDNPETPPKLIGAHPAEGEIVGWTFETLHGNWAAWMSSRSQQDRSIEVHDIAQGITRTVANGVVYRPGFWDDNTVVWLQYDESEQVKLTGMDLATDTPWETPQPLREANMNGLESYVLGPDMIVYVEQGQANEKEFSRLWVWRHNWAQPLLVDEGEIPHLLLGDATISGDYVAFFASQPYTVTSPQSVMVFNAATGTKRVIEVESDSAAFVEGQLQLFTNYGTNRRVVPIAELPAECATGS